MIEKIISADQVEALREGDFLVMSYSEDPELPNSPPSMTEAPIYYGILQKDCIAGQFVFELRQIDDFILGEPLMRLTVSEHQLVSDGIWWVEPRTT